MSHNLDLETKFWETIGLLPSPVYGADMTGSLTRKDYPLITMNNLETILKLNPVSIPGICTPYLYFGQWRTCFCWHSEDMELYSINYLHLGAPKAWNAIPPAESFKFEELAAKLFPNEFKKCPQFLRHKTTLVSPAILKAHGITVNSVVQKKGELIVTFPFGYHAGFNHGYNCAEATNFAMPRWVDYGKMCRFCRCGLRGVVEINMSPYIEIFQPKKYEDWLAGVDHDIHPEDPNGVEKPCGFNQKFLSHNKRALRNEKRLGEMLSKLHDSLCSPIKMNKLDLLQQLSVLSTQKFNAFTVLKLSPQIEAIKKLIDSYSSAVNPITTERSMVLHQKHRAEIQKKLEALFNKFFITINAPQYSSFVKNFAKIPVSESFGICNESPAVEDVFESSSALNRIEPNFGSKRIIHDKIRANKRPRLECSVLNDKWALPNNAETFKDSAQDRTEDSNNDIVNNECIVDESVACSGDAEATEQDNVVSYQIERDQRKLPIDDQEGHEAFSYDEVEDIQPEDEHGSGSGCPDNNNDSDQEKIECSICSQTFIAEGFLKQHGKVHVIQQGNDPYVCAFCEAPFNSDRTLRLHVKKFCRERSNGVKTKVFTCPECGQEFQCFKLLKYHIGEDGPHSTAAKTAKQCPHEKCKAKYKSWTSLHRHIKTCKKAN